MKIEMKIRNQLAIIVQDCSVRLMQTKLGVYFCITDIAKISNNVRPGNIVINYLNNHDNEKFLTLWEHHYNSNFNSFDFGHFKSLRTRPMFPLTFRKWINETNSIGIKSVVGRYGGTYAHRDIVIHFTASLNMETYIHLNKELQRLKEAEQNLLNNPIKIPLEEIIAEANRIREVENDKFKIIGEEEE